MGSGSSRPDVNVAHVFGQVRPDDCFHSPQDVVDMTLLLLKGASIFTLICAADVQRKDDQFGDEEIQVRDLLTISLSPSLASWAMFSKA